MNKFVLFLVTAVVVATGAFAQGKSVSVELTNPSVTVETKVLPDGTKEVTTKNFGFPGLVVQMRDFLLQKLEDKGFDVSADRTKAPDFVVKINAVLDFAAGLTAYSIQVQVQKNGNDKAVARKLFKDYDRTANEFPDHLSTDIATYLKDVLK